MYVCRRKRCIIDKIPASKQGLVLTGGLESRESEVKVNEGKGSYVNGPGAGLWV